MAGRSRLRSRLRRQQALRDEQIVREGDLEIPRVAWHHPHRHLGVALHAAEGDVVKVGAPIATLATEADDLVGDLLD